MWCLMKWTVECHQRTECNQHRTTEWLSPQEPHTVSRVKAESDPWEMLNSQTAGVDLLLPTRMNCFLSVKYERTQERAEPEIPKVSSRWRTSVSVSIRSQTGLVPLTVWLSCHQHCDRQYPTLMRRQLQLNVHIDMLTDVCWNSVK